MADIEKLISKQLENYKALWEESRALHTLVETDIHNTSLEKLMQEREENMKEIHEIDQKLQELGVASDHKVLLEIGDLIQEIMDMDNKSVAKITEAQGIVLEEMKKNQKGQSAAKGYGGDDEGSGKGNFVSVKK